jgi:hypothetical protein
MLGFEILSAVIGGVLFYDITSWNLIEIYKRFEEIYWLHFRGRIIIQAREQ